MYTEIIWANAEETLKHFEEMFNRYGTKQLRVWQTDSGKSIDEDVLLDLVAQGKLTRTVSGPRNMWTEPRYELDS